MVLRIGRQFWQSQKSSALLPSMNVTALEGFEIFGGAERNLNFKCTLENCKKNLRLEKSLEFLQISKISLKGSKIN